MAVEGVYFRQLLSGRDFAVGNPIATQMRNFAYLIGDAETRECVVVDPAYAAEDLVEIAEKDGMRLVGALATHHHPDHIGGSIFGFSLNGLAELLHDNPMPVHVHREELSWVSQVTDIAESELTAHEHADTLTVGRIDIEVLHTPGHTPGSQCFLVEDTLIAGDTLFLEGCGRTDLPGGDAEAMFHSLQKLAELPETLTVYPGHWYSSQPHASLASVKTDNYVLRPRNPAEWHALMAG